MSVISSVVSARRAGALRKALATFSLALVMLTLAGCGEQEYAESEMVAECQASSDDLIDEKYTGEELKRIVDEYCACISKAMAPSPSKRRVK